MTNFVPISSALIRLAWGGIPGQKRMNTMYTKVISLCIGQTQGRLQLKIYINEDYIPINSSALGTEYVGIGVTTGHLLNLTSLQAPPPKYNIIQLIFRNLLCQSSHHTHNQ